MTQIFHLYDLLNKFELESFYESFIEILNVQDKEGVLKVTCQNLQNIGVVSRCSIRKYEELVAFIRKSDTSIQIVPKNESVSDDNYVVLRSTIQKVPVIISPADVVIGTTLGAGQFGKVLKGEWLRKNDHGKPVVIPVAIKALSDACQMSWKQEVAIFTSLNQSHSNIIKFFGLLVDGKNGVKIVTEFAVYGSLLEGLRKRSISSVAILSQFAVQIASGMDYLHSNNLVHRDLSARNILVTAKDQVKVSDFGLSKILNSSEGEWIMEANEKLPIRWLSPESYKDGVFTTSSDVWSFAVCLWEIFSFGDIPWSPLSNEQVMLKLENCHILSEPQLCPFGFYDVMTMCFQNDPANRPSFRVLHELLCQKQPELLEVTETASGLYDLNITKGDYINLIKPINTDSESNIWLSQHSTTLLFGKIDKKITKSISYNIGVETSSGEVGFVSEDLFKDHRHENKANESIQSKDPFRSSIDKKHIGSGIDQRPNATYQKILQNEIIENEKQIKPPLQIDFHNTKPIAQECVNDRISKNWTAFLQAIGEKKTDDAITSNKDPGYLNPIDVSCKLPLELVINSVDPYAITKSSTQNNLHIVESTFMSKSITQSDDELTKIRRLRPKSNLNLSHSYSHLRNETLIKNMNRSCESQSDTSGIKQIRYNRKQSLTHEKEDGFTKNQSNVANGKIKNWYNFDEDKLDDKLSSNKIKTCNSNTLMKSEIDGAKSVSEISQHHKEEFYCEFKKIKSIVPQATIAECLSALKYANNDTKKAVRYLQVQILATSNKGFSREQCENIFTEYNFNLADAQKALKTNVIKEKYRTLNSKQIEKVFQQSNEDMHKAIEIIFFKEAEKIGFDNIHAKGLLAENDFDVIKALEFAKILRVAEITSKPEQECFRVLVHCQWQVERAVDFILTK